jgi:hypothetical protein
MRPSVESIGVLLGYANSFSFSLNQKTEKKQYDSNLLSHTSCGPSKNVYVIYSKNVFTADGLRYAKVIVNA